LRLSGLSNIAVFVYLDDFAKLYQTWVRQCLIPTGSQRQRCGKLSLGEMLFIIEIFHTSGYRCFKLFCGLAHFACGICNFINEAEAQTLIATHNMELAKKMDRRGTMRDGKLVESCLLLQRIQSGL
jgi:hypothetical protein